jgi:hypothetical protein
MTLSTEKIKSVFITGCLESHRRYNFAILTWVNCHKKLGVAELRYEIQKADNSNSYSLLRVRLEVKEIHT